MDPHFDEYMDETRPILVRGICPSCGQVSLFDLVGIQRWPRRVALHQGVAESHPMWQCLTCQTTLLEASILPLLKKDVG